ncbi:transporter substrate-binding domain-containing protein [Truepera radiovictrix]|nr:transporter substrate-binding domain-containing protein [Truepera radiovictrix]WMT55905.1 transporter substrate-binding domain-containing protein [Truepera radiovictrix]
MRLTPLRSAALPLALLGLASLALAQEGAQDTAVPDLGGRTLLIGSDTTYPPFETVNQEGEIVGFDVDVMNAICERINCVAQFQTTAWDGIFAALANGEFDMVASGVSITPEREQIVDFTIPYYEVSQAIAVRVGDEDLTIADFEEGNLVLGAQTGTTNAMTAERLAGRERTRLYDTFATAIQALLTGDVDGVVIDDVTADAFAAQYAGQLVVSIREVASGDQLGFVVPQGDPLVDALNAGIEMIQADGTLDALVQKWLVAEE